MLKTYTFIDTSQRRWPNQITSGSSAGDARSSLLSCRFILLRLNRTASRSSIKGRISPTVAASGDSYDNALAESINGQYKAEVIHRKSWKNHAEVELPTLAWVDWFNNRRLLERLGHIPPVEAEKAYYASSANNDLAA